MRKLFSAGILILGLCLAAAAADDWPKAEVFGGVSFLHVDLPTSTGIKKNYMGWDTEFQYNVTKLLGVTADVAGNYGRLVPNNPTAHAYTFVFGPTFSIRREHATIFAHTLFGENSTNLVTGGGSSDSAFAMAWGGGIDVNINHTFAVRLGQLDWLYTRHDLSFLGAKNFQNNIRYAGGITINLGGH
jgi:hypothetical protein